MEEFEYLDDSIEILAMIHNGVFEFSCQGCPESFKKDAKCLIYDQDNFSEESVYYEPYNDTEYANCPISMIHPVTNMLYDRYMYIETIGTTIERNEMPGILWWFIKRYKYYSNQIQLSKIKIKPNTHINTR